MKGVVLEYDAKEGSGFITTDDGRRFSFGHADWREEQSPQRGMRVDFLERADATAQDISFEVNNVRYIPSSQNMGFVEAVKICLHKYADFSGRARRKEYWYFYLFQVLACFFVSFIISLLLAVLHVERHLIHTVSETASVIVMLIILVPTFATGARRLHDIGRSGWWQLLYLTIIGSPVVLVMLCLDTKPENNQWGQPAR